MKKILKKILKLFKIIFNGIYKIIDLVIITPLSKFAYWVGHSISNKNTIDRILNNPNTLVYVSLFLAVCAFFAVDLKIINLTETESIVLSNQPIKLDYNEEAYVIEGVPETGDIVLMGRKSDLYLAEQLGDHLLTLDLTDLSAGKK